MDKDLLGTWGASLEDTAYARAVAQVGVIQSRVSAISGGHSTRAAKVVIAPQSTSYFPLYRWRAAVLDVPDAGAVSWQPFDIDPTVAAASWKPVKLSIPSNVSRIPSIKSIDRLLETLARAEPRSLIVEPADLSGGAQNSWRWPLRVGVFTGPDIKAVEYQFAKATAPDLFPVVELDGCRESCDLLIVSESSDADPLFHPREARPGQRVRATVVVSNVPLQAMEAEKRRIAYELRRRYQSSAVLLIPGKLTLHLVQMFLRELSHNASCDEAIFDATRKNRIADGLSADIPYILAVPDFMEKLRIQDVSERYDRVLLGNLSKLPAGRSAADSYLGAVTSSLELPGALARRLAVSHGFMHETGGASDVAAKHREADRKLEQERLPRSLHTDVFCVADLQQAAARAHDAPPPVGVDTPMIDSNGALLVICVGPSTAGVHAIVPLDETQLDFTPGKVQLHVLVQMRGATISPLRWSPRTWQQMRDQQFLDALPPPLVKQDASGAFLRDAESPIDLPEAGDSSLAAFWIVPDGVDTDFEGRITLLYRNRALQTARLCANVLAQDPVDQQAGGVTGAWVSKGATLRQLTLIVDPEIRSTLDDLDDVRDFDATLLAWGDIGAPWFTSRCGGEPLFSLDLTTAAIKEAVEEIDKALERLTRRSSSMDVLPANSPLLASSMFTLASYGRSLYDRLPDWLRSPHAKRIQVVTRGHAYFPAEFVYEGDAPKPGGSSVCINGKALEKGSCGECPNQKSPDYICPLRFWGLSRTIERHSSIGVGGVTAAVPAARTRPSAARTPFGDPSPVLHGAAARAYNFATSDARVSELTAALRQLAGSAYLANQNTWGAWIQAGKQQPKPKLFVALPHSDELNSVPVLELGMGDLLSKAQIRSWALLGEGSEPKLMLLLGCSVANATVAFAPYPEEFRAAGADIVIAPLAPILGADSVPIASEFATLLHGVYATGRRTTLGEILADLRRRCLSKGNAGVLGVVAYGDADWVFG